MLLIECVHECTEWPTDQCNINHLARHECQRLIIPFVFTEIPLLYALIHFVIVASSIAVQGSGVTAPLSELNDVFDPTGDAQQAFMNMVTNYPNFVAEEWIHTLSWDLFVGRYIWLDGLKRGILTAPAVLFADLIGPPGLLIYFITCLLSGKPILDKTEKEELENL